MSPQHAFVPACVFQHFASWILGLSSAFWFWFTAFCTLTSLFEGITYKLMEIVAKSTKTRPKLGKKSLESSFKMLLKCRQKCWLLETHFAILSVQDMVRRGLTGATPSLFWTAPRAVIGRVPSPPSTFTLRWQWNLLLGSDTWRRPLSHRYCFALSLRRKNVSMWIWRLLFCFISSLGRHQTANKSWSLHYPECPGLLQIITVHSSSAADLSSGLTSFYVLWWMQLLKLKLPEEIEFK